ncbi:metallophosphoesterase family protein [Zavarzinia compransoris]|uniref:metallophosphoesterase family protein n=1 Tax=Zavarzinia marina TaxID=2911065 RepID=UPI001F261B59|nr:metallophosphoesterase family protein [Zavarzinia marina]MCF4165509.1 metallophosphoesterase family protein [Zavarzinia marina]
MPSTFFTSDTHFGHERMVRLRGFASKDAMDAALIERWNRIVGPDDTVHHLGDVSFRNTSETRDILERLNGTLHLVEGNHDSRQIRNLPRWASVSQIAEIKLDGLPAVLCHFRMAVWNRSHHGALHFHGHCHGAMAGDSQCLDVGVDTAWADLGPIGNDTIRRVLAASPAHREPFQRRYETT